MTGIRLIVGLGNPGTQYAKTRHNVGAWFVDYLAEQLGAKFTLESKLKSQLAKVVIDNQPCFLCKPTTYMNESGQSVGAVARFYKIEPRDILVVHDELDFEPGVVRLKEGGGHGGHNGLRDIISHLSSRDFFRLRLGIGHPGHKDGVSGYVLRAPGSTDRADIIRSIDEAERALPDLLTGKFQQAFHQLHSD